MGIKFWTWETWGIRTRRRDHKGCPAQCGHLRRTHSRGEAEHLKLQTSCRDGPAKTACMPDIRKSSRLKNQPAKLHGKGFVWRRREGWKKNRGGRKRKR